VTFHPRLTLEVVSCFKRNVLTPGVAEKCVVVVFGYRKPFIASVAKCRGFLHA